MLQPHFKKKCGGQGVVEFLNLDRECCNNGNTGFDPRHIKIGENMSIDFSGLCISPVVGQTYVYTPAALYNSQDVQEPV